ncbi:IS1634 family transposase [bacterium AH-315-G05]|nr:IS1634 family transposase [Alkaliphilus sp. AH-315-G20]MBN4067546.1 IS1634 family transposase [Alkaliphilus transvaalensis]MBN4069375.1 IS1634 family transposase [bacterium AH-315-G05]
MYISKSKTKSGKYYISISKGIRDPETKKAKKIMIKSYGTFDLNSKEGKKALSKAEADLDKMIKLDESSKGFVNFEDFILSLSKDKFSLNHKNIGYLPYIEIFKQLKLPSFFAKLAKGYKQEYNFSDMMFYQVLGRLFNPSSKIEVASRKDDFLYDFNFVNNDNIYSSLDIFSDFNKHKSKELTHRLELIKNMEAILDTVDSASKIILEENIKNTSNEIKILTDEFNKNFKINENKLFKHLNKSIEKMMPDRNMSLAFYDCTTYYFESFNEDDFRERGMSKENKRNETQVVMGLLIDSNGIPISYRLFEGNKHELHTMEEVIDDVLKNYTIKEIIIVADRGLNSKANLEMIRGKGLNYIVGSKGSSVPKNMKEKKFNSSWKITSKKDAKYKSGYITGDRTVIQNGEEHEELIIKKYSDLYKEREMFKQNKMLERAKKNIKDFTINATTKSKSKYYKAVDNPKKKITVEIDEEKIKNEQENFGYFYIVTNKIDMDPADVMIAYKSLYKIEESFRILKTNLKARPVYHFKERRVRAHFLICYLALVLQRILEYKLAENKVKLSTHEIINGLEGFILDEIDYKANKLYIISDKLFNSKINSKIFKIKKNVLLSNEIPNLLKKM